MEIADLMEQISENEDEALQLYELDPDTSQEELIRAFKETGIANWQMNLALIDEVLEFDLEENFELYLFKLKEYTEVRSAIFSLILKAIEEDSDAFDEEIEELEKRIALLLAEIEQIEL